MKKKMNKRVVSKTLTININFFLNDLFAVITKFREKLLARILKEELWQYHYRIPKMLEINFEWCAYSNIIKCTNFLTLINILHRSVPSYTLRSTSGCKISSVDESVPKMIQELQGHYVVLSQIQNNGHFRCIIMKKIAD